MSKSIRISKLSRRAVLAGACVTALHPSSVLARTAANLREVASSERSWVQVAVAPTGRVFVNFSRWFGPLPMAVAEILPDGTMRPYPDAPFNSADPKASGARRAVSVQSVVVDPSGRSLWIVDAGNPQLGGLVPGGAKLVEVDLAMDRVRRTLLLDATAAPAGSYLADMRIDAPRGLALLPDLALGAIAVVDLKTGRARRVLEGHVSTRAEDLTLTFDGKPWLYPDGSRPKTAVTSIALSPDGALLYYKALVGRTLYSVPVSVLADPLASPERHVRKVADAHPSDAMTFGPDGALYLTAIDRFAITRWRPGEAGVRTVIQDDRLAWPVGLTFGPGGEVYATVGRIHEGGSPRDRFRLYRFTPPAGKGRP